MQTRYFALVLGIIFIIAGLAGFIPGLKTLPPADYRLSVGSGYGLLFGLFPVNILHDLVHLLFGIWGVVAYRSFDASRTFARVFAVVYGILTICGLIPGLNTVFGLVPLYGHDIWLHALSAIAAAWFGFGAPARTPAMVSRT